MKSTDLRLGNLVEYKGEIKEVKGLHRDKVSIPMPMDKDREALYMMSAIYVSGIPLAEEWLLRFGFEKKDRGNFCQYENDEFTVEINNGIPSYSITPLVWRDIKYVHQLQNLCFALTGEELKAQSSQFSKGELGCNDEQEQRGFIPK